MHTSQRTATTHSGMTPRQLRALFSSILGASTACAIVSGAHAQVVELSDLASHQGIKFSAPNAGADLGLALATIGDINGDGYGDFATGAPYADYATNNAGASYVIFGGPHIGAGTIDLATLDGTAGFRIYGERENDYLGWDIAAAGDVNNDGFHDFLIGSYANPNGHYSGAAYLIFGKATFGSGVLATANLELGQGIRYNGAAVNDLAGVAVDGAGDFNGDEFADLLISTRFRGDGGGAYVVYGKASTTTHTIELAEIGSNDALRLDGGPGEWAGRSVSAAGDFNGDGFDDIIIGSPYASSPGDIVNAGGGYVVFGKANRSIGVIDLPNIEAHDGIKIQGFAPDHYLGWAVAGGGDINGDGLSDVVVATPYASEDVPAQAFVILGQRKPPATLQPSVEIATKGSKSTALSFIGPDEGGSISGFGRSVSNRGDFNRDGMDDLLIGAFSSPAGSNPVGVAYLTYGKKQWPSTVNSPELQSAAEGLSFIGEMGNSWLGYDVTLGTDINGDGTDDLLLGAPRTDLNGNRTGTTYVVFGIPTVHVKKLQVKLSFAKPDNDSISLKGSLPVDPDFSAARLDMNLEIAGTSWTVQLDDSGKAKLENGLIKLGKEKKGVAPFSVSFKKETFQDVIAAYGLLNGNYFGEQVILPVSVELSHSTYMRSVSRQYWSKQDKSGKTK